MSAMAGLQMLSQVSSVASLFMRSGSGGAIMRAQFEMSRIILGELDSIQTSLANLTRTLDRLERQIHESNAWQYQKELTGIILQSAGDYRDIIQALSVNKEVLYNDQSQRLFEEIEQNVRESRGRLWQQPEGRGPLTAMITPIALSMEIGASNRLGMHPAMIRQKLKSYSDWFDSMLSPEVDGSVISYLERAKQTHDGLLAKLSESKLGKMLKFDPFDPQEENISRGLAYFADNTKVYQERWIGHDLPWREMSGMVVGSGTMDMSYSIDLWDDDATGAILLKGVQLDVSSFADPVAGEIIGWMPKVGTIYNSYHSRSGKRSLEEMKNFFFDSSHYKSFDKQRRDFSFVLKQVNVERARMVFAMRAIRIIENAKRVLEKYDSLS